MAVHLASPTWWTFTRAFTEALRKQFALWPPEIQHRKILKQWLIVAGVKKKKSQGWNLRESLVFLQEAVIKTYVGLCLFILGGCYQVSDLLGLWTANVLMNVRGFITLFGIGLSSIDQVVLVSLSPCWRLPHHTHTRVHVHTCLFLLEALIK